MKNTTKATAQAQNAQHTAGEWVFNKHSPLSKYYGDIKSKLGVKDGIQQVRSIAISLKYAEDSENEANARLISAAPDLLAALEDVYAKFTPKYNSGSIPKKWAEDCLDVIQAAINKAKGQ